MSLPNGISFRSTALAGSTSVTDYIESDRRTDHATVTPVAIVGIAINDAAYKSGTMRHCASEIGAINKGIVSTVRRYAPAVCL